MVGLGDAERVAVRRRLRAAIGRFAETLSRADAEELVSLAGAFAARWPADHERERIGEAADEAVRRLEAKSDADYGSERALRELLERSRTSRKRLLDVACAAPDEGVRWAFRIAAVRAGVPLGGPPPPPAARAAFYAAELRVLHSASAAAALAACAAGGVAEYARLAGERARPDYGARLAARRGAEIEAAASSPAVRAEAVRRAAFEARHAPDADVGCPLAVLLAKLASAPAFEAAGREHLAELERLEAAGDRAAADRRRAAFSLAWPEEAERCRGALAQQAERAFRRRRDRASAEALLARARPWETSARLARERLDVDASGLAAYAARVADGYCTTLAAAPGGGRRADGAIEELRALRDGAPDAEVAAAARRVLEERYASERRAHLERLDEIRARILGGCSRSAAGEALHADAEFRARWPAHAADAREAETLAHARARDAADDEAAGAGLVGRIRAMADPDEATERAAACHAAATEAGVREALAELLREMYAAQSERWRIVVLRYLGARSAAASATFLRLHEAFARRWPRHEPDEDEAYAAAAARDRLGAEGGEEGYARRLAASIRRERLQLSSRSFRKSVYRNKYFNITAVSFACSALPTNARRVFSHLI